MTHSHELAALLVDLGRAGLEVAAHPTDAARLRFRPADLAPELAARLRTHRGAILRLLASGYTPDAGGDREYLLGERLATGDGLGMPTHPGAPAWLIAAGESMGAGCEIATNGVYSGRGSTHEGHNGGGEGERRIAICDRQRRGRGP